MALNYKVAHYTRLMLCAQADKQTNRQIQSWQKEKKGVHSEASVKCSIQLKPTLIYIEHCRGVRLLPPS